MSGIATTEDTLPDSSSPPLVDRLSSLPSELLHHIFESAYSTRLPKFPLSKYLYPFFERHRYRKVYLSSPRRVKRFLKTISAHPGRGKSVVSLEFDRDRDYVAESFEILEILEALLPLLPLLRHLEVRATLIEVGFRSWYLFNSLASIRSVTTDPELFEDCVNLDYFAFLAWLPSLADLTVYSWYSKSEARHEEEEDFQLSHVKTLRIEGWGADDNSIKALVDLSPRLSSIALNTTYSADPVSYAEALRALPSTLQSLTLGSSYASIVPKDHLLRRFTQLRSLDLDEGCYSKTIHKVLSHLPLLKKVRLGSGRISPPGFLPLVSGLTRLAHLEQLVLDLDVGVRGRRISRDSYAGEEELEGMDDWSLPEPPSTADPDDEELEGRYELEDFADLKDFVARAGVDGVEVKGQIFEALANVEDYWIETSNRAVLSIFLYKENTDRLRQVRIDAIHCGLTLPSLNFDSLDLEHLELVKIDLPYRDWFMYSLRSRNLDLEEAEVSVEGMEDEGGDAAEQEGEESL